MRAIHSDIRHSIWRELNDRIDEQGIRDQLKITDNDMRVEYALNTIQAHGFKASSGSHTAKLKSLANYNTVHIEEADEVGEQEFMTLDDSLRTVKGDIKIILTLNAPPKNHWIIRRFFDLEPNLDRETVRRYQSYENTKPSYYYQVIKGYVPEVVRGRIYSGWQLIDSVPQGARLVRFGEDFGWYPDPACAVAIYYWNGGYVIDELAYGTELTNEFLAGEIKNAGAAVTIADSAEPKSIAEQNKYGISVKGCEKGKDSVNFRIKVVSQKKIFVTRRSTNVWQSYENYAWAEDKDGNPKGEPQHMWSHAMDALGYPIADLHNKQMDIPTMKGPRKERANIAV
jgi:phage terminase large subunit